MSVIRVARRNRYTTIDRRTVNDDRLSFRARGVLQWLLDKPDDWKADAEDIAEHGTEGRDAIRTCLRELEALGYLVRRRWRDPGTGRWVTEHVLFEHPSRADDHEDTTDDHSGKPALAATGTDDTNPLVDTTAGNQRRLTSAGKPGAITKTGPKTVTPQPPPSGGAEHHGQHPNCRRCGTNRRGPTTPPEPVTRLADYRPEHPPDAIAPTTSAERASALRSVLRPPALNGPDP
jgi:hypothetical protein